MFGASEVGGGLSQYFNNEFANFETKFETSYRTNISPAEVHLGTMNPFIWQRKHSMHVHFAKTHTEIAVFHGLSTITSGMSRNFFQHCATSSDLDESPGFSTDK